LIIAPPPFSAVLAWTITQLLSGLLMLIEWTLRLPGATFRVPSSPMWFWATYLSVALVLVIALQRRRTAIIAGSIGLTAILHIVIAFADFSPNAPQDTVLTFLDVGQGDSVLVEFPSGQRTLIDGGGVAAGRFLNLRDESTFSIGENVVSAHLFSRGIRHLDFVVLSHAHHDHIDGLFDVIENFTVGEFCLGRNPMTPRYRELVTKIQEKQIPIRWVSAGQTVGGFEVLHPPANWIPRKNDQNNDSVVLALNSGSATVLLTGDLERPITVPTPVDVLKVPHHGSKGVRSRIPSTIRVISVGANNPFGHPHMSALPALRTDQLGAITITIAKASRWPKVSTTLTDACQSCKLAMLFGATKQKD
jgi:competence protein ComEC